MPPTLPLCRFVCAITPAATSLKCPHSCDARVPALSGHQAFLGQVQPLQHVQG